MSATPAHGTRHVVLFGASGFLGAHVRTALEQHRGVARVTCAGRDRCDLVAAEVDELAALLRELGPDVVVNCTGRLDGTAYDLVRANTSVTAKLIDAIGVAGTGTRLVRLGSAGEYGSVTPGQPVTEEDPAVPVSAYGMSHLAATRLLEFAVTAGRVDGCTLRVFNPIGPGLGEQTLLGRAAARLRAALAAGETVITMGPLGSYRDFVDARDVAAAVVAAALRPGPPPAVLNIGSGRAVAAREAVGLLAGAAGFTGEVREQGLPSARSAAVDWICADITRAGASLGWRPAHELCDSVKAIWAAQQSGVTGP
jgi:nucleoside-diphosphate-sugar epimerase